MSGQGDITDRFPTGLQDALTALYGPANPLTPDEQAAYDSERARKDAEAWRRIRPQPQLEIAA